MRLLFLCLFCALFIITGCANKKEHETTPIPVEHARRAGGVPALRVGFDHVGYLDHAAQIYEQRNG